MEKTIIIKKGFVESKESTKEVCIIEIDGVKLSIAKPIFDEIKKEMGW